MIIRLVLVLAVIFAGLHWWQARQDQKQLAALTSSNGFLPVPMPEGAARNTVMVFAPHNCPREGAQRAAALTRALTRLGISNVSTSHYGAQVYEPNSDTEAGFRRLSVVMNGEVPIVLVNGMGKANPTVDEVVAEYRRTQ
jgi:hypothetical protein